MTIEEARKILEHECEIGAIRLDTMYGEAINVAIKALEQEPSGDLISREELLKAINTWDRFGVDDTNSLFRLDNLSLPHYVPYIHYDDVIKSIKGMPSVKPQEPKTGHWYDKWGKDGCSVCNEGIDDAQTFDGRPFKYCPMCGARMIDPQESEEV